MKFVAQLLSLMLVLALVSTKAKHTKSRKNKFNIKNLRTPKVINRIYFDIEINRIQ